MILNITISVDQSILKAPYIFNSKSLLTLYAFNSKSLSSSLLSYF